MKTCTGCRGANEDDATVCIYCGQDLDQPSLMGRTRDVLGVEASHEDSLPETEDDEQEGTWEEAIAKYDETIRLDPEDGEAYFNRGEAYLNLGQYDLAAKDFEAAVKLDPEDAEAYFSRGIAYYNLGELDRAIQDYDEAIRLDPEDPEAHFNRGIAYFNLGEYTSAFDSYNAAIQLDPEDGEVYAHAALAGTLLGRDAEAEVFAEQAMDLGIAPTLLEVVIEELKKRR